VKSYNLNKTARRERALARFSILNEIDWLRMPVTRGRAVNTEDYPAYVSRKQIELASLEGRN
jgi:hypothetical protein